MTNFSYAKLRSLENMERQSPELTNIGNDFYKEVFIYMKELEKRFEEERNRNPSSKKILLISDELRNTKRIWKSIFERREKKIVQAALSAARGGILHENRNAIFERGEMQRENEEKNEKQEFHAGSHEPAKDKEIKSNDNKIIRILKDVPPFVGSDMKNYSLKKEDVISMPKETAEILINRKAAEEIRAGVDLG